MITLLFLFIHSIFALFFVYFVVSFFTGAPYVPTPGKHIVYMLQFAGVKSSDMLIDIGSGDGRIVRAASRLGARSIGWEINPILVLISNLYIFISKLSGKARVQWGDYRKADLSSATVVFVYGIVDHMETMEKKFKKDLAPGSRVLCYTFPLPNLKPKKQDLSHKLYLYQL